MYMKKIHNCRLLLILELKTKQKHFSLFLLYFKSDQESESDKFTSDKTVATTAEIQGLREI